MHQLAEYFWRIPTEGRGLFSAQSRSREAMRKALRPKSRRTRSIKNGNIECDEGMGMS